MDFSFRSNDPMGFEVNLFFYGFLIQNSLRYFHSKFSMVL